MKFTIIISLIALFFGGCVSAPKVGEGKTLAKKETLIRALQQIGSYESQFYMRGDRGIRAVGQPQIVNSRIALNPKDSSNGEWIEVWGIARRGYFVEYALTFTPNEDGSIFIQVQPPAN